MNSVIFILFVARFENRLLDIAPAALAALYLYAILQVCLPFVTQDFFKLINVSNVNLDRFTNFVLIVVLLGKVTLLAVLHYVLDSGRIFYYFLTLRKFHIEDEGGSDWEKFKVLVTEFGEETEVFSVHYARQRDGSYVSTIPGLFEEFSGPGKTPAEAKKALVHRICGDRGSKQEESTLATNKWIRFKRRRQ